MAFFEIAHSYTGRNEGKYSAPKASDTGGETYCGVARVHWPDWEGWALVDEYKTKPNFPANMDADVGLAAMVSNFYRKNFWQYEEVQSQLFANVLFDIGVNASVKRAVMLMQAALGLKADGVFGPNTLAALNAADQRKLAAEFAVRCCVHYALCVINKPDDQESIFDDNLLGWFRRAIRIVVEAYNLPLAA
jgi:lysozyme family protein